ncbi:MULTISPECIES: DUF6124 family protein [Pseudomonas]|uniref:DUF6124 family protein n=1 Tax=Pseudomonas wuhanensis TaxID=2954098 RepID=A0ABY9GRK5_9PSED|nr:MULTISPECIES: DUF6124 family protein [unclassified Pseudomonas]WLI11939.1 DUF6124 family protein [Pseudomonas sp. FP603]WLI17785.1 DUF6124 family protein [Pseudomonas sp. FP607]
MKKITLTLVENPATSEPETLEPTQLPQATERAVSARRRNLNRNIFSVRPDVDTLTLLAHASETLASLNVMTMDFADRLEGPQRNVALALQQLTMLTELLVNRARDNLDPNASVAVGEPPVLH